MSGFYNNWYKVQHPTQQNDIVPMKSGGYQTPFYFGGSQVPINLDMGEHQLSGSGIGDYSKMNFMPMRKGIIRQDTNFHKASNIHLPRHMGSLYKRM